MKAKELDPELFPRPEVVKAYEEVGLKYEWTIHDRVYQYHFYPKATANNKLKEQEIKYQIDSLQRTKNHEGEWLTYHVSLFAKDWKGNKIDYSYMEGMIEGMPTFHKEIDPQTDEVIPGSTQIDEIKTIYKIPFSKHKVKELEKHFKDGNVAQRKIEESIDFEASVLKDRLLRLQRLLEDRIQQHTPNDSITDMSNGAQVASNLAITIFKLEFEGMKARQGAAIKLEQQKANRYLEIANQHQTGLSSSSEESESEEEAF